MEYRLTVEPDESGMLWLTCPQIPEFSCAGDDLEEALLNAVDALETALEIYIQDRRAWPLPDGNTSESSPRASLPALAVSKALLHNEMLSQNIRKAELARRLHVAMPQVDRLLDVRHKSRLEGIEQALEALGRKLVVGVV